MMGCGSVHRRTSRLLGGDGTPKEVEKKGEPEEVAGTLLNAPLWGFR